MPACPLRLGVDLRCPPVLANAQDQRLVQEPAGLEVADEPGISQVEAGEQVLLQSRVVIVVCVPGAIGEDAIPIPENGDELRSSLNKPAGREAALAEERHAVRLADSERFPADIERVPNAVGRQQSVSPVAV